MRISGSEELDAAEKSKCKASLSLDMVERFLDADRMASHITAHAELEVDIELRGCDV